MNYTASFLNFRNKKIVDELENPILTIRYTEEIYPVRYSYPTIIFNSLSGPSQNTPIYKLLTTMKEIDGAGLEIYMVAIPKEMAWITRSQRTMLILKKKGSIPGPTEKKMFTLPKYKDSCKVQVDEANLKARLISRKAGPNGEGPWIQTK